MKRIVYIVAIVAVGLVCGSCWKAKTAPGATEIDLPFSTMNVEVMRVIDGDTFVALVDGKEERYRLL